MQHSKQFGHLDKTSLIILFSVFLVSSCSHYRFNTNLDSTPIQEYFALGDVKIYQANELDELNYQYLATLEGESCQQTQAQAPANDSDARTHARQQAAKLKANGIVFTQCISLEANTGACLSTRLCSGKAIKVILTDNTNE